MRSQTAAIRRAFSINRGGAGAWSNRAPGTGFREDPAVERAAEDDRDATLPGQRQESGDRSLIEQGVPTADEEAVVVALVGELDERRGVVHRHAERVDAALRSEALEGPVGAPGGLAVVEVRLMDERDVDPFDAEAAEALLE